jgi:ATP-dependent RNA helicase DDX31/DBP7
VKSSGNNHKSASARRYAERREAAFQTRLEETGYWERRKQREEEQRAISVEYDYDGDAPDTSRDRSNRDGPSRDRDRDYKRSFVKKNIKATLEPGAAPNTRATAGAEEALPVTTLHDTKASVMTKEEKIKEQRIGNNTALLTPKTPFEALGLEPDICEYLEVLKFTQPTKIQAQAIPALIEGRDALIQAQTGSGKTLCYLLPVLNQLQAPKVRLSRDDGTHALILAPTRELVIQIEEVWKQIAKPYYWLVASTIMGGAKKKSEKARLRKGCHVVIGTPGRIVDHLGSTQSWMLGSVNWFILDEADRLFDLGFRDDIGHIYEELMNRADNRPKCALVSATLSKKQIRENVFELSALLLQNPVAVGFDGVTEIENDGDGDDDDDGGDDNDDDQDEYLRAKKTKTGDKDGKKSGKKMDVSDDDDEDDLDDNSTDGSDDDRQDSDDDEEALQMSLLNRTLNSNSKTKLTKKLTDSSSDSDSDDADSNPPSIVLPHSTVLSEDRLLPQRREKSMGHLGDMDRHATTEETQEAVDAITTSFVTPTTLEQLYVKMSSRHRLVALASFLRLRIFNSQQQEKKCKMIVFVSTCASVEFLHKIFQHAYWPDDSVQNTGQYIDDNNSTANIYNYNTKAGGSDGNSVKSSRDAKFSKLAETNLALAPKLRQAQQSATKQALINTQLWKLHGNMPQELRTQTYKRFCDATEGILFSTDVAARGLDLPLIDWIVQYDPPEDTEDYIHRIGRTARIGHSGRAIIFLLESEEGYLQVLNKQGASNLKQIPLATLLSGLHVDLPSKSPLLMQNKPLGAILQKQFEKLTTISSHLNTLAKASYIAFVRAYAAYPKSLKGIFHPRRLHLGEVAHSFALTETPSEITRNSGAIMRIAEATINPMKVIKAGEEEEAKKKQDAHKKSLVRIAAVSAKRQQMAEFL